MLGQVKRSVRHVSVCLGHSSRWKGGLKFPPHNIIHYTLSLFLVLFFSALFKGEDSVLVIFGWLAFRLVL